MENLNELSGSMIDYQSQYDKYWMASDRIGESSGDLELTADQIILTCGIGRTLDIGSGEGGLVAALLRRGVDAHGLDVSGKVVSRSNQRHAGRFSQGSVLALPFANATFQTVASTDCLEHLAPEDVPTALREIYRVTDRYVFLKVATTQDRDGHWHLTVEGRGWWETRCFEAGFRKHSAYYRINSYESLNVENRQIFVLLEKIPQLALSQYPLDSLRVERDLHMDMMRESGSRSDAHVARYQFATKFIRSGDVVLDAACGLGYGSRLAKYATKGSSFIGFDSSDYAIQYAKANYADESISFQQGVLPDCLALIPSNSIDFVFCFETLEHVRDPVALLAEFQRVLTPGGRITCSVPNDWSDETGIDPNPFHFHVYNQSRFVSELIQFFDIEQLYSQTADRVKQIGGGSTWIKRPRSMIDITLCQFEVEAEWLVAVAAKSPLTGYRVPYVERVFSADEQLAAGNALAFARDYSNPWLIRSLISIGLRTENVALRTFWASSVLNDSYLGKADRGAALCVLAYAAIEKSPGHSVCELLKTIEVYLDDSISDLNPTVLRWRTSLMFAAALLEIGRGRREVACSLFKSVIDVPVDRYSPTLLTKPAEAAFLLGQILLSEGRADEAHQVWSGGLQKICLVLGQKLSEGYEIRPPTFEIREMATALSLSSRLVASMANSKRHITSPSVFYDECHGDSVAQIQSHKVVEAAFASLRDDYLGLQTGLNDVVNGKDWLESQWKASEAERSRLQEAMESLLSGKEWLESQWKVSEAERSRLQEAMESLLSGKEWLESQWKVSEAERSRLQEAMVSLLNGKEWLESQWRAQALELDERQKHIDTQQSQIDILRTKNIRSEDLRLMQEETNLRLASEVEHTRREIVELKQSFLFRFARKIGIYK